jgi:transposase
VAKLAQAHGLNPNMVFKWRRQLRAGLFEGVAHSAAVLLPVALPDAPTGDAADPASLALQPVEPHRESVPAGMVDPVQLRLVLRCLMPA